MTKQEGLEMEDECLVLSLLLILHAGIFVDVPTIAVKGTAHGGDWKP